MNGDNGWNEISQMKVQKMDSNFLQYINNIKVLILKGREIREQELKNERERQ